MSVIIVITVAFRGILGSGGWCLSSQPPLVMECPRRKKYCGEDALLHRAWATVPGNVTNLDWKNQQTVQELGKR